MNLDKYKDLISRLPVRQQSFTTKRKTWAFLEEELAWFKLLNNKLFGENDELNISRQDIFETTDIREVIVKTIYWGYSRGMRNNYHRDVFAKVEDIEAGLIKLINCRNLSFNEFEDFKKEIHMIRGIKLSTYSKLLYFLNIRINDNPCLILDQRLIDVFKNGRYTEFDSLSCIRYSNAEKKYLDFLKLVNQVSLKLETKGENIEQFIFVFGGNLKYKV